MQIMVPHAPSTSLNAKKSVFSWTVLDDVHATKLEMISGEELQKDKRMVTKIPEESHSELMLLAKKSDDSTPINAKQTIKWTMEMGTKIIRGTPDDV